MTSIDPTIVDIIDADDANGSGTVPGESSAAEDGSLADRLGNDSRAEDGTIAGESERPGD